MSTGNQRLSVVIPTYNCRNLLARCLKSISWVDEIIIVDMGSTDGTIQLARQVKAKVYQRTLKDSNFDNNLKYGMKKAVGDWVMKLDSDEVISVGLQNEIRSFLRSGDDGKINGYHFYNRIFMFGKMVKHGFIKPLSHELRMFRRGKWQYNPYRFYQQISVEGRTAFFKGYYVHFNHRNVKEFITKMNKYTSFDSGVLLSRLFRTPLRIAIAPVGTFAKIYFLQKGFLDGLLGLEVSILYSIYNLTEKVKLYERSLNL